jgi:acyl carrier protein
MKLLSWLFGTTQPRGIHFGKAAAAWASTRLPAPLQSVAAYVADLLCEQLGVTLSHIEPTTTFTTDLQMDENEPVEFVMVLEEDLCISIPDDDYTRLTTVQDLVLYLHKRLCALPKHSAHFGNEA